MFSHPSLSNHSPESRRRFPTLGDEEDLEEARDDKSHYS